MGASIALPSAVREFTVVLEIYLVLSRKLTTFRSPGQAFLPLTLLPQASLTRIRRAWPAGAALDPEASPHYHSPA
jgi:hypothetical protein